jgi:hypothetical protein
MIVIIMGFFNYYFATAEKPTSLSFSGSPTISIDDKLIFSVGNSNQESTKVMRIYALSNTPRLTISISDFFDNNSGKSIESSSIKFNNEPKTLTLTNIIQQVPKVVTVSIDNINKTQPGVYYGSIFLDAGNRTSIPFIVDIKPNLGAVIIIVVDGILISIFAWKVIIYSGHKQFNKKLIHANMAMGFGALAANATQQQALERLRDIATHAGLGNISLVEYIKNPATYDVSAPLTVSQYLSDTAEPQKMLNETIQTIGTILFGIAVSGLGLFNNGYVTTLHNIGSQETLVLLGIGLGIGSLKDFVDKFNSKNPAK